MAWNEPGNNGRDPWGGGNRNDQGPPDLDEVVKKLQQGLNGLFGKSGGGSGGGSDSGDGPGFDFSGKVVVSSQLSHSSHMAHLVFTKLTNRNGRCTPIRTVLETKTPGLRWNAPIIEEVNKVNVTRVRTHTSQGVMLTKTKTWSM